MEVRSDKEVTPKAPDINIERKPSAEIRQEVLSSIKDGKDKEGKKLFNAYKDSIKDPEKSSFAGETYKKAEYSHQNLDKEGEANKLVVSLDALYRQAGVEEGYKPQIKQGGDLSENEIQRLIRDRVAEDFQKYPELYAENKIGRYVEAAVKVKESENQAVETVDKDMVRRADLRAAIYEVQQARTGLYNVIEEETKRVKDEQLGTELVESIKSGLTFEEKPLEKNFEEIEDQEQSDLIGKSADEYKKINPDAHEKHINAVDSLTDEEKKAVFGKAAEADREIQNKKANLKEAMLSSPENAAELASELRSLQVEKRLGLSEASVAVAKKRSEVSKAKWKTATRDVLTGMMGTLRGKHKKEEAWSKFKDSTNEWIGSKKDEVGKRIGKEVGEAASELGEGVDENLDGLRAFYEKVDDKLLSRVKGVTEKVGTKFKKYREDLRDSSARVEADTERRKIIARKTYYRSMHNTKNYYRESMVIIGAGWRSSKETAKMNFIGKIGEIFGIEETGEDVKLRAEVLRRYDGIQKARVGAIGKSKNPYMEVFKRDLNERFGLVGKMAETASQKGGNREEKTKAKVAQPKERSDEPDKFGSPPFADDLMSKVVPNETQGQVELPADKGLGLLHPQELKSRRNTDEEYFNKARQNLGEEVRGEDWETTLEKANNRFLRTLKEVNRRLDGRVTEVKKGLLMRIDYNVSTKNLTIGELLKRIEEIANAEQKSEHIEKYSKLIGEKESKLHTIDGK